MDKGRYRHDSRADKNPYRHDRRADSLSQSARSLTSFQLLLNICQLL